MITKKDLKNIESLFILSAISQHSGKRKASGALNTSVDTINKYIDNLEHELGVKLLVNSGRGCVLTSNAKKILEHTGKIKGILDDVYDVSPDKEELNGDVRVAMSLTVSSNLLPSEICRFFDEYPDINLISFTTLESPNLNSIDVDLGITTQEPNSIEQVVMFEKKIDIGYFASSEYLSQNGYPKDIEDMIKNHRIVKRIGSESYSKQWKELIKRANHVCFSSNSAFALGSAIRNGLGIGLLPLRFKNEGLVCLDNIKCDFYVTFYLVARRSTKDIPRIRAVLNFYKSVMEMM